MCSNIAMNASITYPFIPGLGFNLINTLASTPGMPCHCRAGVRTTQLLVNAKLTSISKHLDDLDATLASSSLPIGQEPPPNHTARGLMSYASNP